MNPLTNGWHVYSSRRWQLGSGKREPIPSDVNHVRLTEWPFSPRWNNDSGTQPLDRYSTFFGSEILRTAYGQKDHVNGADVQCFRRGDSIFDCSQVAEVDPIHGPAVRNIQFRIRDQAF